MPQFKNKIYTLGKEVWIQELSLKEYKALLKSLISVDHSPEIFCNFITDLLLQKTSLQPGDFENISVIDFFILIMFLKCTSSSSIIDVQTENTEKNKVNLKLNVIEFINTLKTINVTQLTSKECIENNIAIEYDIPSFLDVYKCKDSNNLVYSFIKKIHFNESTVLDFKKHDFSDKKTIYNNLPLKAAISIKTRVNYILDYFNELNLLDYEPEFIGKASLLFNFNKKNLSFLLKLLFGDDLKTIYSNQFLLAKHGNMSAEYIDSCTVGEYSIFIQLLNKSLNESNKDSNTNHLYNDSIEK